LQHHRKPLSSPHLGDEDPLGITLLAMAELGLGVLLTIILLFYCYRKPEPGLKVLAGRAESLEEGVLLIRLAEKADKCRTDAAPTGRT
jgi:hypothetical protein